MAECPTLSVRQACYQLAKEYPAKAETIRRAYVRATAPSKSNMDNENIANLLKKLSKSLLFPRNQVVKFIANIKAAAQWYEYTLGVVFDTLFIIFLSRCCCKRYDNDCEIGDLLEEGRQWWSCEDIKRFAEYCEKQQASTKTPFAYTDARKRAGKLIDAYPHNINAVHPAVENLLASQSTTTRKRSRDDDGEEEEDLPTAKRMKPSSTTTTTTTTTTSSTLPMAAKDNNTNEMVAKDNSTNEMVAEANSANEMDDNSTNEMVAKDNSTNEMDISFQARIIQLYHDAQQKQHVQKLEKFTDDLVNDIKRTIEYRTAENLDTTFNVTLLETDRVINPPPHFTNCQRQSISWDNWTGTGTSTWYKDGVAKRLVASLQKRLGIKASLVLDNQLKTIRFSFDWSNLLAPCLPSAVS